jgi:hypothetical protein
MKELVVYRNWRVVFVVCVGTAVCLVATALGEDELWKPESTCAVVPTNGGGTPILIPVVVGDRKGTFLLDTGSARTLCDLRLLKDSWKLSGSDAVETHGSNIEPSLYEIPSFQFAGIRFTHLDRITCWDMKPFREALGVEIDGLLGMDVLRHFVTHIDLDHRAVVFATEASGQPPGKELQLVPGETCPTIEGVIHLAEPSIRFMIDTGDLSSGTLDHAIFQSLLESRRLETTGLWTIVLRGDGTAASVQVGRAPTLTVGGCQHKSIGFSPGRFNDLGLYFICRYRVTLDPKQGKAHLQPSSSFDFRDRSDASGIAVQFEEDGRKFVSHVVPGSIAERAGAVARDEILEVNGSPAENVSRFDMNRLLYYPSREDLVLRLYRFRKSLRITIPGQ